MYKTKNFRLSVILSLVLGLVLCITGAAFTLFGNTKIAKAYASEGDRWFTGINATAETFTDKPLERQYTSAYGFTTEITPESGNTNVAVVFNQTVQAAGLTSSTKNAENIFNFENYKDEDGNTIAVADMIVITFTSVTDPTKQVSVINYNADGWGRVSFALTDDLEYRNGRCYIKGTSAATVGLLSGSYGVGQIANNQNGAGTYNGAPIYGCDNFYLQFLSDGTIQHNQWWIYGNITSSDFLSASITNLPSTNAYYSRYTSDYVASVMTAMQGKCSMTITYYGIHTEETLRFRMRQINNTWLGDAGGKTPTLTYPFSMPKKNADFSNITLLAGKNYTVADVIDSYSTYRANGVNTVDWSGWIDGTTQTNDTWISNTTAYTKTFVPTGDTKTISIYTRFAPSGQSWSDRYVRQDISFNVYADTLSVTANTDSVSMIGGKEYDLSSYFTITNRVSATPTVVYKIDGNVVSSPYTSDGLSHTLTCEVSNAYGASASASIEIAGIWTGDTYFTSTNGKVNYAAGVAGNMGGNAGMRTTVSNITEDNITLTFNQALQGTWETFFSFDKYVNSSGDTVAVADMIVITLTSVNNPDYQISLINYYDGTYGWGRSVVALTDDVEYRYDEASQFYRVYIKGTDQQVVGLDTTYKASGTLSQSKEYGDGSALFGASYYYFCVNSSGSVYHNGSRQYADITSDDYLNASTANLSSDDRYYSRYTSEHVSALLTEFNKSNSVYMQIKYVGLHLDETTSDVIGFNTAKINNNWLSTSGLPNMSRAFAIPKVNVYAGETYHINDVLQVYSALRVDGVVVAEIRNGWVGLPKGDATSFAKSNGTINSKTFTPTAAGDYTVIVYVYCNADGQSWGNEYLYQEISLKVCYRVGLTVNGVRTEEAAYSGAKYCLPTLSDNGNNRFVGWTDENGLYAGGTYYTLSGGAELTAVYVDFSVSDTASARLLEPYGIRFKSSVNKSFIDGLNDAGVTYSIYTIITSDMSSRSVRINVSKGVLIEDEDNTDNYIFKTALVNIRAENTTRVFYADSYIEITYADGTVKTVQAATAENRQGRSYAQVIKAASDAGDSTATTIKQTLESGYIVPVFTIKSIDENGEETDITYDIKATIESYFAAHPVRIGDTVDLTDYFNACAPTNYSVRTDLSDDLNLTFTYRAQPITVYYNYNLLIEDGVSKYSALAGSELNATSGWITPYAAHTLQQEVIKTTGATISYTTETDASSDCDFNDRKISLGKTRYQAKALNEGVLSDIDYNAITGDGFFIKKVGNVYLIDGNTKPGVINGVYYFLENVFDVNYIEGSAFKYGGENTAGSNYYPSATTVEAKSLDVVEIPAFGIRDIWSYNTWQWQTAIAPLAVNSSGALADNRIDKNNYDYDYYGYYYGSEANSKYGQPYTASATRIGHTAHSLLEVAAYLDGINAEVNTKGTGTNGYGNNVAVGYCNAKPAWYAYDPNYRTRVNAQYGSGTVTGSNIRVNDWGYSQEEICWTNGLSLVDGLYKYVAGSSDATGSVIEKLISIFKTMITDSRNDGCQYIFLGQADYYAECQCSKCKAAYSVYDGDTSNSYSGFGGVVVNTVNEIAKEINAWMTANGINKTVKFVTFAGYSKGHDAPKSGTITLQNNVVLQFCYNDCSLDPLYDYNFETGTFTADSCTHNADTRTSLAKWIAFANGKEMSVWDYSANFTDYLWYMPNLKAIQQNYIYYDKMMNVNHVLTQENPNEYNYYGYKLHYYVISKLMWNPYQDVDALIEEFNDVFFGDYASYVNEYLTIMDGLFANVHGGYADGLSFKTYSVYGTWGTTDSTLHSAITKINNALSKLLTDKNAGKVSEAEYNVMYAKLCSVKITPQYMLLYFKKYGGRTVSDYSSIKTDLRSSIGLLGIRYRNEAGASLTDWINTIS